MRFSVVIATLGRPEILRETLRSVGACEPPAGEALVVDADGRRSAEPVAAEAGARYLTAPPGLTRQRNVGLAEATGDVVVFLDDDVRVPRELFARLAAAYEEPDVVGATGRVVEPEAARVGDPGSKLRRVLGGEAGTFTRFGYPRYVANGAVPQHVEYMLGCFMSARLDAAREVGFDEELPGYGLAEDEDFSYRLSRLGRIRFLPELVVEHLKLGFGGRDLREHGRQVAVNRRYLFRKNFPQTAGARAQFSLFLAALVAHRLVNREWRGAQGLVEGWARRKP